MNEQAIYAATVRQVVRLERQSTEARERLRGMAVWVAGRALAEGGNADRAAWAALERQLHQVVDVLAAPVARTAAGPEGTGGDAPDGPLPGEPLGGPW